MHTGEEDYARPGWTTLRRGQDFPWKSHAARMTEDRDKWRKYVHGVANYRIEDGSRTEQNRTEHAFAPDFRTRTMSRTKDESSC